MSDDLVPVFIPALVVGLLNQERAKGASLTRVEVEDLRDRAVVTLMNVETAQTLADERGYDDLDPELAWEQWRVARRDLLEPHELRVDPLPVDLVGRLVNLLGEPTAGLEILGDLAGLERGESYGSAETWSWHDLGVCVSAEEGRVVAAFLYGEAREGFDPYPGALPEGLTYSLDVAGALALCGEPLASSTAEGLSWHKFQREGYLLHVQFTPEGDRIVLLTLLAEPVGA
ncbi:MAG: hypothetical protein JKY65_25835 [Planctomycetes bacterium]|nr:hypothetical protein [Planctomycetota bacterium]